MGVVAGMFKPQYAGASAGSVKGQEFSPVMGVVVAGEGEQLISSSSRMHRRCSF